MVDQPISFSGGNLNLSEQEAFSLSQAAVMLDQARGKDNSDALAAALDHNMELWIGIRTLVTRDNSTVTGAVRENLVKLANFVARTTLDKGVEMPAETLESLININLQISEGLLEGNAA